ncbi:diguanylate cyclase [Acidihalobacter yilgarnensis]|uniref:diguanylate cyclase n=1 Tax=Acidihalobacter yilgarnensis TaxID=2819280 RepID=A0A1D8ILC5_9GAMM|nr:diguanylate cyclase [Acidihalobacter yilgarnensis]AOU97282.1 diguanylate cyclase [Acidihalobacter yilgarnensis]
MTNEPKKTLENKTDIFVGGLDKAIDTHMDWTRRILRCAVLGESPGNDVLRHNAHTLCQFGIWFNKERGFFDLVDANAANCIERNHLEMHNAIRILCEDLIAGRKGQESDLKTFEKTQAELITLLSKIKTLVLTTVARRDPLTDLPMRFGIDDAFDIFRKDAKRRGERLFVVLIDVDHFKDINDTYGHGVGDAALRQIAARLTATVRENESLYRYGGEEFLILLRCPKLDCQIHASRRIHEAIRSTPITLDEGATLHVTITQGVAEVGVNESFASAVERADMALYEGKRAGRDRYVVAQGEPV